MDGTNITGKIVGTVSKSNIDGVIDETGVYLLDGSRIKGIFDQSEEFAKNLLVGDPVKIKSIGKIETKMTICSLLGLTIHLLEVV